MKREVSLNEISDGKLYGANDMVKADCQDCYGCSACCRGMGSSVVLDPLDIHRMTVGLHQTMEQLLAGPVELNVVDGLILPNLKMAGEQEACSFLNEAGRCSIHVFRPGICRLFPLGRIYENGTFRYFLQNRECRKENRTKVKVRKWLDTPDFNRYETYIAEWHYFLLDLQEMIARAESEKENRAENREKGRAESKEEGRAENRKEGRAESKEEGRAESKEEDRAESKTEGRAESKTEGRAESGLQSRAGSGSNMVSGADIPTAKQVSMYLLKAFYLVPFDQKRDFFDQFEQRLKAAKGRLLKG